MRKILLASAVVLCVLMPASAGAMGLELSLGKGAAVSPDVKAQPTNIMVAPGIQIVMVRLSVGIVADLPDVKDSVFDLGLRPMLTIDPPILPLYGRLVFAINNLRNSDRAKRTVAYGGALGLSFGIAGVGIFAEAGLLPRSLNNQTIWVLEGRIGVSLGF
jgi:hypothetical protein